MTDAPSGGGLLAQGVVQIHPTLRCNLRCSHCYSRSGPRASAAELRARDLLAELERLRSDGYSIVSVSGGEPFSYSELEPLCAGARSIGLTVNLVTNGTLVTDARLERLAPDLGMVAVSLDGTRDEHDRMRRSRSAYDRALEGIETIRRHGIRLGVVLTVTSRNLHDVPDVFETALSLGAASLTLRPLARVGRGSESDTALDGPDLARLFVLSHILDRTQDEMRVRTDVVPVPWLLDRWHHLVTDPDEDGQLADVLNPLVIDEHGGVVPFAYGFRSVLGHVGKLPPRHSAERRRAISGATTIVADVLRSLESSSETHVDWYERLVHQSDLDHRLTIEPRRAAAQSR